MELLINIDVDDLPRGIDFYAQGLGLRLNRKLFDGTVAEMLGGNTPIYLLAKPAAPRPTHPRRHGATTAATGRRSTSTCRRQPGTGYRTRAGSRRRDRGLAAGL